jgi:hypothetical protein
VPQDALVFAEGDKAVFTLWYFHLALQKRPDMVVIATDLLPFDWYRESLETHYPTLQGPDSFVGSEILVENNPTRPVCFVQYIEQARLVCSDQ